MAKMKWESENAFLVLERPDDLVIQDSQREQLAFFVCDAVDSPLNPASFCFHPRSRRKSEGMCLSVEG